MEFMARDACMGRPEILIQIFKRLSLRDRKNVRLTCTFWKECCTRPEITTNETIVLRMISETSDIARLLQNWSYARVNFEFQCIRMQDLPAIVWETCGPKIETITLLNCHFDPEWVQTIIHHCVNLSSLGIFGIFNLTDRDEQIYSMLTNSAWDYFVERRIEHRALRSLCIISTFPKDEPNKFRPSDHYLENLFRVFPNLENLRTRVGDYIPDKERLETLRIEKFTDLYYPQSSIYDREDALPVFFAVQGDSLRAVHSEFPTKHYLFSVFELCPNLREFRANSCDHEFTEEEITRIFASISKLRCLEMSFKPWIELFSPSLPTYANLNVLSFNMRKSALFIEFLKRCPALKHLRVFVPTYEVLNEIFKNKLDLKTLIILDEYTIKTFTGPQDYSMKRLDKLQHLEIRCIFDAGPTISNILQDIQFPRLKYLKLYPIYTLQQGHEQLAKPSLDNHPLIRKRVPELGKLMLEA